MLLGAFWVIGKTVAHSFDNPDTTEQSTTAAINQTKIENAILAKTSNAPLSFDEYESPEDFKDGTANLLDEQWVMQQDREHFTIQLGTSPDADLLKDFIPLINTDSAITLYPFKTTDSGRFVYGLSTGIYEDLETALQAVDELPKEAVEFGPWIRPIKELQKQISQTIENQEQKDNA